MMYTVFNIYIDIIMNIYIDSSLKISMVIQLYSYYFFFNLTYIAEHTMRCRPRRQKQRSCCGFKVFSIIYHQGQLENPASTPTALLILFFFVAPFCWIARLLPDCPKDCCIAVDCRITTQYGRIAGLLDLDC